LHLAQEQVTGAGKSAELSGREEIKSGVGRLDAAEVRVSLAEGSFTIGKVPEHRVSFRCVQ
jgi:hypothetical protein